jgi:hypothetical protein
MATS